MATRIGFDQYTIGHQALSPLDTLQFAVEHGLDGVQFLEPAAIDPGLSTTRLTEFRRKTDALGLYLEIGLPSPNPTRRSRAEARHVSAREHARDLIRHVEGVAALGCSHARVYVGDRHDRFRLDPTWKEQVAATVEVIRTLTPCLLDHKVKLAIETHADLTVDELLALLDRLNPDVGGVTLDTGNLAMRLDDPLRAVQLLAPRVLATHVKDCVLEFSPRGLSWQARAVGSGILPMPDLLAPLIRANRRLNLSIELHPRTYELSIDDPDWLKFFPGSPPAGLSAVVRLANDCEALYTSEQLPRPQVVESIPWSERAPEWLAQSLGYLRRVIPAVVEPDPVSAFPRVASND